MEASSLRWRKEGLHKTLYDEYMAALVSKDWTVHQTLEAHPGTVSVFIRLKTDCVGCWLVRFCTLEEVSGYYGIPIEVLLESLQDPVPSIYPKE